MSRKTLRQRFPFQRAKARPNEASINVEVLRTQKVRLRFCARQKKENRATVFIHLAIERFVEVRHIFLRNKLKPAPNPGMSQGFDVFLRTIKAKIIVELGRGANLFSRFKDPKLSIGGSYHGRAF